MRISLLWLFVLLTVPGHANTDFDRDQIKERISPIGKVRLETTTSANKAPTEEKQVVEKERGEVIYEQYCGVCHRDGVAGAPKFRNPTDWSPRQANKNLDLLTKSAIKGLNAMPAKGTCQECSDEDIKAAVIYMVPKS